MPLHDSKEAIPQCRGGSCHVGCLVLSCFVTFLLNFQVGGSVSVASCRLPRLGFPEGYVPKDRREATWNVHWGSFGHSYFIVISYNFMHYFVFCTTVCLCPFLSILSSQCMGWYSPGTVARWTPFIGRSVLRQGPQCLPRVFPVV